MNKKENAVAMDPNRFKMAKNMAVVPGGPMNNNPMNVTSVGAQPGSMTGVNQFPYGDSGLQNAPQMGADILNPMMVQNSGLQQNMPLGRGKNGNAPYGMQQQPSPNAGEPMEGMRWEWKHSPKDWRLVNSWALLDKQHSCLVLLIPPSLVAAHL